MHPASFAPTLALTLLLALTGATAAHAQDHTHAHGHTSPYADFADREIKALSADEVQGLLDGAGLGMALPAELNGYPGPLHVLEMGEMLGLTEDQRSQVEAIRAAMQARAQELGREVVALERALDRAFVEKTIDEAGLTELLEEIGLTRARLRAAHLRAHLQVLPLLTESQRQHYAMARGYTR